MNYKVEGALKKNRKKFIVGGILWLILVLIFISPFSYSIFQVGKGDTFDLALFLSNFTRKIIHPFKSFGSIFSNGAVSNFLSTLLGFTIIYIVAFIIGVFKSAPKSEYTDIEHGSSDWSQHGEQYAILNKNKGIILAENNYLPVDKRGNVNVLVVGRFWFW